MTNTDVGKRDSSSGPGAPTGQDLRHQEREADRRAQRERELMCLPLDEWTADQRLDFEKEMETRPPVGGRLRPVRDKPAGPPRQVNPFLQTDPLGRPPPRLKGIKAFPRERPTRLHEAVLRANVMGLMMTTFVNITGSSVGARTDEAAADLLQPTAADRAAQSGESE